MTQFRSLSRAIKRGHLKHEESGIYKGSSLLLRKTRNGFYTSMGVYMPTWFVEKLIPAATKKDKKPLLYS